MERPELETLYLDCVYVCVCVSRGTISLRRIAEKIEGTHADLLGPVLVRGEVIRQYFGVPISAKRGKGEFFYVGLKKREEDARTFRALCGHRKIDRRRSNPTMEETAYLCFSYKLNSAHVKYYRLLKATYRRVRARMYAYVCDLSIFFCSMNTLFGNFSLPLFLSLSLILSLSSLSLSFSRSLHRLPLPCPALLCLG